MTNHCIRPATSSDLATVLSLYRQLHRDELWSGLREELSRQWAQILSQPGLSCFVLEVGDIAVSSCCLAIIPNLTHGGRPYGVIENVVTDASYRRCGYGTAVVKAALDAAWTAGCYKVMLWTGSRRQGTHRFYEGCGFKSGEKTGFVARPRTDGPEDDGA